MKKPIAINLGLVLVVIIAIWLWPEKGPEQSSALPPPNVSPKLAEDIARTELGNIAKKANLDDLELSDDPYENQAIRAQLLQVADLYAETAKYPHTSQPILDPATAKEAEPFKETEVDTPFPVDGLDEPIRLQAAVDRYQYFAGDVINARLTVAGAPADTFISAQATLSSVQGGPSLSVAFNSADDSLTQFTGGFDTKVAPPGSMSTEMLLKLQVTVGEQALFATVPLRYSDASAQLAGIQYARPEAENLVVALQYGVFQAGYYFVSGVLEDARTGQPLVRLQGEKRFIQGNDTVLLRAHISALRTMGSEGPYVLRSIKTYRGSETGETYDVPASSVQDRFSIQGFGFDQYDNTPHQDADAQERIEFLENLAGGDDSPDPKITREEP